LSRNGAVLALTKDHNPKDPLEMARIKQLGGTVKPYYSSIPWPLLTGYSLDAQNVPVKVVDHVQREVYYITSFFMSLAVSRALGDHTLSVLVNHEPDVTSMVLDGTEEFLVLGSDGLFDVMTNEAVVQFIRAHMKKHGVTHKTITSQVAQIIVNDLVQESFDIYDHDNVTVTVILFR
jgi:serine/threonine protein phosphatase PrpC